MGCHCDQPDVNVHINLGDLVAAITGMESRIMARVADVLAKVSELNAATVELAKDVQRLIADGDTAAAVAAIQTVIDNLSAVDAAVESASPEPEPAPAPEPGDGGEVPPPADGEQPVL